MRRQSKQCLPFVMFLRETAFPFSNLKKSLMLVLKNADWRVNSEERLAGMQGWQPVSSSDRVVVDEPQLPYFGDECDGGTDMEKDETDACASDDCG
jgi:hypothetical protein